MSTPRTVRRLLVLLAIAACAAPLVAQAATAPGKPTAPKATTGGATVVHGTSATLVGTVDPGGAATSYSFEYGPTIAYGKRTTPGKLPAGTSRVKVGQPVSGLLAGYHYRLLATNEVATAYGKDHTFGVKKTSGKSKFTLAKATAPTVYGGTYVLSGTLAGTGNANRALVLQASPYPFLEAFTTVGLLAHTDPAGRFSFHVPHLVKTTQFRVATLDPRPLYSRVTTQQVAVKVTMKVRSSGTRGLIRVYGTVTPAEPGAHLELQLFKAVRPGDSPKAEERTARFATQFSTLVKKGTATVSRFSVVVKIARGGSYRAYASLTKRGAVTSGASRSMLLHAAPGSSKRH
jgi:hypothetical protein